MDKGLIVAGVVIIIVIGLLLLPMVTGIFNLSLTALRVWAVTVTVALPGVFVLGYLTGSAKSKSTLDGLDRGVSAVSTMATQVADIRDRSFKKTVQHAKPVFNVAMLPQLPQTEHTDLIEGEARRVDL